MSLTVIIVVLLYCSSIGLVYQWLFSDTDVNSSILQMDLNDETDFVLPNTQEEEDKQVFNVDLYISLVRSAENAIQLSGVMPSNCVIKTTGNKWFKNAIITCGSTILSFEELDESDISEYSSYVLMYHSSFGDILKVVLKNKEDDNVFNYVSITDTFEETSNCTSMGLNYSPPCGINAILTNDTALLISCTTTHAYDAVICDEIIDSISIVE